jgi:P4 family phage/plasmid primase-like protien
MQIDVEALKASADIVSVIGSYVPLKRRGHEYIGLCPFHDDHHPSFYVIPAKRFAYCHACDANHDVISFVQEMDGVDFKTACEKLGAQKWEPKPARQEAKSLPARTTSKPPESAEPPSFHVRGLGNPVKTYTIRDTDGSLIAYECRYEGEGKKEIRIWSWGARGGEPARWGIGHCNAPRPLYGLERLSLHPDAPVLITEGPKKADAGAELLPAYASISWTGGANAWHKHDYAAIAGRSVLIVPDNDEPGRLAAEKLAALLSDPRGHGCKVRVVDPTGQPEAWDLADAAAEGWDTERLIAWAKPRAKDWALPAPTEPKDELPPVEAYADGPPPTIPPSAPVEAAEGDGDDDEIPLPVALSEDAIADAFAAEHQQDWRYVSAWGHWLHWDGDSWQRDRKELVDRLAVEMCRRAVTWKEAQGLTPDGKRRLGQRKTAGAVRDMARSDRRIAATPDGWDSDPLLVGIPGGVFDVKAGKVIMGEREQYITRRTSIAPDQGEPKRWLEHLKRMMGGDESMIRFLQLFAGYCATGDTREQCFLFLYGMGQTGKGTFLLTLHDLLGDYAAMSAASTFMAATHEKHSSEIARLSGCRLVVIDETDGSTRWNEERLKRMTGGGKITAALKYHDEGDIQVTWKLAFAGNHKPALRGVGKEMERRIRLVKCTASIPDESVDRNFRASMIAQEGPQILNWILQGAVQWHDAGLPLPDQIQADTRDYLTSEDVIGDWLTECTEDHGECSRPDAYRNFTTWMDGRGDRAWSSRAWWSAMEDRGHVARKTDGQWRITRLSLKFIPQGQGTSNYDN